MPRALAIVATVVAGCGGTAPRPGPALPPPTAAKPTCADIGVILRGSLEDETKGPDLERAIATTCGAARWSPEVVDCIASQADPDHCIEALSTEQQQAYHLARGDGKLTTSKADAPPPPAVDCADALTDAALFAPAIGVAPGPQRDWAIAIRSGELSNACQYTPWSRASRACFAAAHDPGAIARCRSELEPAQARSLDGGLTATDTLVAKSLALLYREPPVTCNAVAARYYPAAESNGDLEAMSAAQRKKAVADSRAAMAKACNQEKWNEFERACLVVGGGPRCFAAADSSDARWGFPAQP